MRRTAALFAAVLCFVAVVAPAGALDGPDVLPLPNGFHPEGIVVTDDGTFYVGSLFDGAIYRGDVATGAGAVFSPGSPGRATVGLSHDPRADRVFAAGGPFGTAHVVDGATGARLADYTLPTSDATFINDVIVTRDAAWFTDSSRPVLYKLPFGPGRSLPAPSAIETVPLTGDFVFVPGAFNSNGITASDDGATLILAGSSSSAVYAVDAANGHATAIDLDGATLPNVDGVVLRGRTLFAVQNFRNQVSVIRMAADLKSGWVGSVITSPRFRIPTTADVLGRSLFVVNARFDVAPPPFGGPPVDIPFEVVKVPLRGS
jgi:hypothetical protein